MIRVLLADDHPVVRSGYLRLLEQERDIRVIAEAATGEHAYAAFVADPPDVLATDLSMPGGGGLELIRRVRLRAPAARILVFSMYDSPPLVRQRARGGARGFLTWRRRRKAWSMRCAHCMPASATSALICRRACCSATRRARPSGSRS